MGGSLDTISKPAPLLGEPLVPLHCHKEMLILMLFGKKYKQMSIIQLNFIQLHACAMPLQVYISSLCRCYWNEI